MCWLISPSKHPKKNDNIMYPNEKELIASYKAFGRTQSDLICSITCGNIIFYFWICIGTGTVIIFPIHDILYYDMTCINLIIFGVELLVFVSSIVIGILMQSPHWNLTKYIPSIVCTAFIFLLGLPYSIPIWIGMLTPNYTQFDSNVYQHIKSNHNDMGNSYKLKIISIYHYLSKLCRKSYRSNLYPVYVENEWIFFVEINKYLDEEIKSICNGNKFNLNNIYHHVRNIHIRVYIIIHIIIAFNLCLHWISFIRLLFINDVIGLNVNHWTFWIFITKLSADGIIIIIATFCFFNDPKFQIVFNRKCFCNDLHFISQYKWFVDNGMPNNNEIGWNHQRYGDEAIHNKYKKGWNKSLSDWQELYNISIVRRILFDRFGSISTIIYSYLFDKNILNKYKHQILFYK